MIGGDHVIQDAQAKAFPGSKQPSNPALSIPGKSKQKLFFMTSMGNVPDMARQEMTIGSRHDTSSLK
jgi:hypothetical protein